MDSHIGTLIQSELDLRSWLQADLARVLGWPVQALSELMKGKRRLDAAMALDLATISTLSAEAWLRAQIEQDLDQAKRDPKISDRADSILQRAELEDAVPMRELVRRGVIDAPDQEGQAHQVRALLGVENIGDDPPFVRSVSAKRTQAASPLTRSQKAWIALGCRAAEVVTPRHFRQSNFEAFAQDLPRRLHAPGDFADLPQQFAEMGVRLVHVSAFPGGRIDGASLDFHGAPLVILSGRGKRIDRVLFALLHECGHVASGHWRSGAVRVHDSGVSIGDDEIEREVNDLAQSWVLPAGLGAQPPAGYTGSTIDHLAEVNGVSRAVVIGQLQHMKVIPWASLVSKGLPTVEEVLDRWT